MIPGNETWPDLGKKETKGRESREQHGGSYWRSTTTSQFGAGDWKEYCVATSTQQLTFRASLFRGLTRSGSGCTFLSCTFMYLKRPPTVSNRFDFLLPSILTAHVPSSMMMESKRTACVVHSAFRMARAATLGCRERIKSSE